MKTEKFDVNKLRVASPCSVGWQNMAGGESKRFCNLCSLNVYNVSEMSMAYVQDLIAKSEGRICMRLYKRADGTVITKDCPVGLRAYQKRVARFAGAALSAVLGIFSVSYGQKDEVHKADPSKTVSEAQNGKGILKGIVADPNGAVIPGATILLFKDKEKEPIKTSSSSDGDFVFNGLSAGIYRLEVPANYGFGKLIIEDLKLQSDQTNELNLNLSPSADVELIGVVGTEPAIDLTTTGPTPTKITREMIDRLPGRRPY
jgi:hypothetical protein